MSIRDRLQGLVELLESKEKPEEELVDEIEKIEELLASEEEEEQEEVVEIPEELEVAEEDLVSIIACRNAMNKAQLLIGQLTMNYEFQKIKIIKKYTEAQKALQEEVDRLKIEKGLPEEVSYSFTLPEGDVKTGIFKKE